MRECMQEVLNLLRARISCIWIDTYEEYEVIRDLTEIVRDNHFAGQHKLFSWSHTEGLKQLPMSTREVQEPADRSVNIDKIFATIDKAQNDNGKNEGNIYIFKDFHLINDTHAVKRLLRDIKEKPSQSYNPIIVISPIVSIPLEHEKLFTVVHYDVPSKTDIRAQVDSMVAFLRKSAEKGKECIIPTEEDTVKIVNACIGLTYNEISDVLALSTVKYKELSLKAIMDEKIQLVQKSGVLGYKIPTVKFEDIGGNNEFKEWINEVESAMSDQAVEFGCAKPKGYMSLGIPGCGKTALAEAIASKFGVPLLMLDMSRIFDKLVGQTEKKIEQALRVAKACSPCVLLIDEAEKALAGTRSSNAADAGTTARMFAAILNFLNENNDVFVIMTSNDVSQLPPELTRSGRLDAIWYFSLPMVEEREEIFKIHLGLTNKKIDQNLIKTAAHAANNFTGAEIQESVRSAMRKAYKRYLVDGNNNLTEADLLAAIKEVIPLYQSSKEKIAYLEEWVKGRARYSNGKIDKDGFNIAQDQNLLDFDLQLD